MEFEAINQYYEAFYETLYQALTFDMMSVSQKIAPFYYFSNTITAYTSFNSFQLMNDDNFHKCNNYKLLQTITSIKKKYEPYACYFLEGEKSYKEKKNNISYIMTMNARDKNNCWVNNYSLSKFTQYLEKAQLNNFISKENLAEKLEHLQVHLMAYLFNQYYEFFVSSTIERNTFYYCLKDKIESLPENREARMKCLTFNAQIKKFEVIINGFFNQETQYLKNESSNFDGNNKDALLKNFVGTRFYDKVLSVIEQEKLEQLLTKQCPTNKIKL